MYVVPKCKTEKVRIEGHGMEVTFSYLSREDQQDATFRPTCVVITNKDPHGGWMFTELVQTNRLTQAPSWVPNTSRLQEAKNSFVDREGNSPVCRLLVPTAGQETTLLASAGESLCPRASILSS